MCTSDGLTVPVDGMEEFCGETTYLSVSIDENNFVPEIQEADNFVSLSTPVTISQLNCNGSSQNQECKYFPV